MIQNPAVGKFVKEYRKALKDAEDAEQDEKKGKLKKTLEEYKEILKDAHIRKAYLVNTGVIQKKLFDWRFRL